MKTLLTMLTCCCALLAALGANASAADKLSPREQALTDMRNLYSALTMDRLKAVQSLSLLTDPNIIKEMDLVKVFMDLVKSPRETFVMRREALRALVALAKNNVEIPGLMDLLNELLQPPAKKDVDTIPFQLRLMALSMLMEVANANPVAGGGANPQMDRAFLILKSLWDKRKDLPTSMVCGILETLGGFGNKPEARTFLMDAILKEAQPEVMESALRGLNNALRVTETLDKRLAEQLAGRFLSAKGSENKNTRVLLLDCLETVIGNINGKLAMTAATGGKTPSGSQVYAPSTTLVDAVSGMLKTGDDSEVMSAVRFLMRVSSRDPKITKLLLDASIPNPGHPLIYQTLVTINMALVDVLINLAQNKSTASKEADEIILHMVKLLNPEVAAQVPAELRQTMILGLSCVPTAFDRTLAVETLIKLLEIEAESKTPSMAMIRDIESALTSLTGVSPFQIVSVETAEPDAKTGEAESSSQTAGVKVVRKIKPDIKRWTQWYEANKANLKAGKTPF